MRASPLLPGFTVQPPNFDEFLLERGYPPDEYEIVVHASSDFAGGSVGMGSG